MNPILSRALPRAQSSAAPRLPSICLRRISYAPNPQGRPSNPNLKNKIPPSKRPLARPPVGPPTISEEALKECKWVMRRTSFAQLPVYKKWRAGDTKQEIQIKKVTGDKGLLVEELKEKLGVPADKIKINPTTGMIVLTGPYFDKARDFFIEKGF